MARRSRALRPLVAIGAGLVAGVVVVIGIAGAAAMEFDPQAAVLVCLAAVWIPTALVGAAALGRPTGRRKRVGQTP